MKMKTGVCPCVEVKSRCLCTPLYSLFALNDQRRSIRDKCVTDVRIKRRTTQADKSYSELCPYVCDIYCTCISKCKKSRFYYYVSMFQELPFCIC